MAPPLTAAAPRTVVLTRQPAQAGALESALAAAGHPVAFLPLTDFVLPPDESALRGCVARLGAGLGAARVAAAGLPVEGLPVEGAEPPAWLVLTSPNAVRALMRCGWDGRVGPGVRVAVTGPGTARVLARAGYPGTPWMPAGDASAEGIVAQFPAPQDGAGAGGDPERTPRTVLLPQSSLATRVVEDGLAGLGWHVERTEAYRTVPYPAGPGLRLLSDAGPVGSPALLTPGDLAGTDVVLTSPSAVTELVARRGTSRPAGTRFFAIGRPTREAAATLGVALDGTAPSPDAAGLLAVLGPA